LILVASWGGYRWGSVTGLVDYYSAEVGQLVVEMADVKNKSFVWRGTPSDTLSDKPREEPEEVGQGPSRKGRAR
jgi:hypothetical protein